MEKSSIVEDKKVSAIKELMQREKLTQQELAGQINVAKKGQPFKPMEAQNLSRALTKRSVSDKLARKIWKLYSDKYRVEWLLGLDDYPTYYEWADSVQDMKDVTADCMWGIFENSLKKKGHSLKFVHRNGQHLDSSERIHADCYYSVVDNYGNEVKRLTASEMAQLEQKLQEYADFLTDRYLWKEVK